MARLIKKIFAAVEGGTFLALKNVNSTFNIRDLVKFYQSEGIISFSKVIKIFTIFSKQPVLKKYK